MIYLFQENSRSRLSRTIIDKHFNELCAIMGDDLAAICPLVTSRLYKYLLELTGGKTSEGKHYVQLFEEGSFLLIGEKLAVVQSGTVKYLHVGSLRAFANVRSSYDTKDRKNEWAQIGTILTTATLEMDPHLRSPLLSMAFITSSDIRLRMIKYGLPVYFPEELGGLGWPHPKGFEYAIQRTPMHVIRAYHVIRGFRNNPVEFSALLSKSRSFWSRSEESQNILCDMIDRAASRISHLTISRDEDGNLTELSFEKPIGLVPNSNSELKSQSLFQLITDKAMIWADNYYYTVPDNVTDKTPLLTLAQIARSYVRSREKLISLRHAGFQLSVKWPDTIDCIRQDLQYIKNVHILTDVDFLRTVGLQ